MQQTANVIPVTLADLQRFVKQADARLARVEWTPAKRPDVDNLKTPLIPTITSVVPARESVSLIEIALEESRNELLPSEMINHVLHQVRTGLLLAFHFDDLYTKASGLDLLIERNKAGKLQPAEQAEFNAKISTRAAIAVFTLASYVAWDLAAYYTEEVSSVAMDVYAPAVSFQNTVAAINSTLFDYGKAINHPSKVNNDLEFVKFSLLYFRRVVDEVKLRETKLDHKEPFTANKYKLEGTEFVVDGFIELNDRSVVSVEFNKVRFEEIVGNRRAKHDSLRIIQWLLCYDLDTKRNPMRELGGLASIRLGHGSPGTGKSMIIAAIATRLQEYCAWLGIPFLFHPLPDNLVSTYQGGSAERMTDWMRVLRDPTKVIYAPIDDAENTFEERTRQGVSAGVREIIAVFLRNTEGAYAVNHGNMLVDFMTNIPDQIDKAVLSRIITRYVIDGMRSENDSLDQDHAWMRKYAMIEADFINMEHPAGYTYMDDQRTVAKVHQLAERYMESKEARIRAVVDKVKRAHNHRQHRFFASLDHGIQQVYPGYSSRDKRNIQAAVDSRILDFDMPKEWFDEPTIFFKRSYDDKKGMLVELMKHNMKGLTFADIRLEETLRYLDGMVAIADKDRERKIDAMLGEFELREEATSRHNERKLALVK